MSSNSNISSLIVKAIDVLSMMRSDAIEVEDKKRKASMSRLKESFKNFEKGDFKKLKDAITEKNREIKSMPRKKDGRSSNKGPYSKNTVQ